MHWETIKRSLAILAAWLPCMTSVECRKLNQRTIYSDAFTWWLKTHGDQCQLFHLHHLVLQTVRQSEIRWWYEHSDQHNNDSFFLNYNLLARETWWQQTRTLLTVSYNLRSFPVIASQSTLLLKKFPNTISLTLFQYLPQNLYIIICHLACQLLSLF